MYEKVNELLSTTKLADAISFKYNKSEEIQEIISYFLNDKKMPLQIICAVLADSSVILEDLDYRNDSRSNHEDLLEAGYILGYMSCKYPGNILAIDCNKMRYYYIGSARDISVYLRNELNKKLIEQ